MRQRQTLVATFQYEPCACLSAKATWDRLYGAVPAEHDEPPQLVPLLLS